MGAARVCLLIALTPLALTLPGVAPAFGAEAAARRNQNTPAPAVDPRAEIFEVTYVAADALYLDAGTNSGLAEGMTLDVIRRPEGAPLLEGQRVAEVRVFAVTSTSAACEILTAGAGIRVGDVAVLITEDRVALEEARAEEPETRFAQIVSFTEGNPLEEELRESRPRPPLPEVNRIRGRIGFEHGSILDRGGFGGASRQEGLFLRADMTRIGGSYWNLTGYWRGRLNARRPDPDQETLTDLTNRVYHIGLYYNNPGSRLVAGAGRLLIPWASSLSTLDGGYIGRRIGTSFTAGAFAGSTPDPTAWNYDPDRQLFGGLVNMERGSFEEAHVNLTAGVALTRLAGATERRFLFLENNLQLGRRVSVFHNMEVDAGSEGRFSANSDAPVVSRSFATLRFRPVDRLALDFSHNHFRLLPTFDPRLVGSGLVDDLLFEGLSGGARVDVRRDLAVYTRLGQSKRGEDSRRSVNQMYGVAWSGLPGGLRTDFRYSLFDGPFGSGTYRSVSVIRNGERVRLDVQAGDQEFDSVSSARSTARYVNLNIDWFVGGRIVVGGGGSIYRGNQQDYDQIFLSLGYRFQTGRDGN